MVKPILKRIIPCLLLRNEGLVKTVKFKKETYIGDPLNAVKIFNEKEVDEIIFLDIDASKHKKDPSYNLIKNIASECFMPFSYGGGVQTIEHIKKIITSGAEKIIINSAAHLDPDLIMRAASYFGSSTIVVSIDVKKDFFGKNKVYIHSGKKNTKIDPVTYAIKMEKLGAGEIMLNSIDKDGTMNGYDIELLESVSKSVSIPVIAMGGAGKLEHFSEALIKGKVSAVSAGSFFIYHGVRKAVLISYPTQKELETVYKIR